MIGVNLLVCGADRFDATAQSPWAEMAESLLPGFMRIVLRCTNRGERGKYAGVHCDETDIAFHDDAFPSLRVDMKGDD
jgi:hypothetical protein